MSNTVHFLAPLQAMSNHLRVNNDSAFLRARAANSSVTVEVRPLAAD